MNPGVVMVYKPGNGDRECYICLGCIKRAEGWWTCDRCHKGCCVPCAHLRSWCACGGMFPNYAPGSKPKE